MGYLLLAVFFLAAGDREKAAALYKEGQKLLDAGKYADAVDRFDQALKEVGDETEKLRYGDQAVKDTIAYYPNYFSGLARLRQADAALTPQEKGRFLDDAISRLVRSKHPEREGHLVKAREQRVKVVEPPPPPPPETRAELVGRLRSRVEGFNRAERYEDALDSIAAEKGLFEGHEADRQALVESIRTAQARAVESRLRALELELERVASAPVAEDPKGRLEALGKTRLPPEIRRDAGPQFGWLGDFLRALEKHQGALEPGARIEDGAACAAADEFESAAERALAADFFPGFRAARNVAQGLRHDRLSSLKAEAADSWERAQVIDAAVEKAHAKCREALTLHASRKTGSAGQAEAYRDSVLPPERQRIRDLIARIPPPAFRKRLSDAEGRFLAHETAARPEALRGASKTLSDLQMEGPFASLPRPEQARALLAAAISMVSAEILEGEPRGKILEKCGPLVSRARELDSGAVAAWRDRVSPKVIAILEESEKR
jgi:hypothetical protein